MNIGAVVEGHGEVAAVPILIQRVVAWLDPSLTVNVARPFRIARGKLVKEPELKRAVELVARKTEPAGPILVLLDADEDAACTLGPRLLQWAVEARSNRRIAVVLAVREYESWLLAAAPSLAGHGGLPPILEPVEEPERMGNPKAWLDGRIPDGYAETLAQPALTTVMDVQMARKADSFDKLFREVARLVERDAPARVR